MRIVGYLLLIVLIVCVAFNRERIYIRDPLASVYRNDVKQPGVETYFNFSNDILLQQGDGPETERTVLQHWDLIPGTPARLVCIRWVACFTSADHVPLLSHPDEKNTHAPQAQMNGRHIAFLDSARARIRVDL